MTEILNLTNMLAKKLIVYKASDPNGSIELKRFGKDYDGGYIIPKKAMDEADVLMGYGLDGDISLEENFSSVYNKPSFGFDCGPVSFKITNSLFTFIPECIGNDKSLWGPSNHKVTSFSTQLANLKLEGKKVFLKVDIEGAEFDSFNDILQFHSANITGIAMEIHLNRNPDIIKKGIDLLTALEIDFVLMHVHANNNGGTLPKTPYVTGLLPQVFEVALINKNLVDEYFVSEDQKHPTNIDMPANKNSLDIYFEITM